MGAFSLFLVPLVWFNSLWPSRAGTLVDGGFLEDCPFSIYAQCVVSEYKYDNNNIILEKKVNPIGYTSDDPDAIFDSFLEYLTDEKLIIEMDVKEDRYYVHAVFETEFYRFIDDVEFRLDTEDSVIHVRSISRIPFQFAWGEHRRRVRKIKRNWDRPNS